MERPQFLGVVPHLGLIWLQTGFSSLTYAPIAAYLVEAFPAKVRYTSVSLPYQFGNGVFDLARGCPDKDRCVASCCAFAGPSFSGTMDERAEGHVWRHPPDLPSIALPR